MLIDGLIYDEVTNSRQAAPINQTEGALDVLPQDPTNRSINYYFTRVTGTTNPSLSYLAGVTSINVISITGAEVGNKINIKTDDLFYQGKILSISENNVSIFPSLCFDINEDTIIEFADHNLNKNGSVTPLEYVLIPPVNAKWDLNTMNFSIISLTNMDDAKFGGIDPLTKGISCCRKNHVLNNYWVVSDNASFEEEGFDTKYSDRSPSGSYGFNGRKKIKEINGVILRINGVTKFIISVNDDLTGLSKVTFTANGHIVD